MKDKCGICNLPFADVPSHIKNSHNINRTRSFKCTKCDAGFFENKKLQRHLKSVHSVERPFKCELCGYTFKNKDGLRQHTKTHNSTRSSVI